MLDGNRLLLSGSFGGDVTDVNESPLRSSRDRIRQSTAEISCLVPPELPVYPAQPSLCRLGRAGGALYRERGASSCSRTSFKFHGLPLSSIGIPGGADGTRVAPSLSGSGLSFISLTLPLHSGGDIFVHHAIPPQVICFSSGCHLQPFHILLSG